MTFLRAAVLASLALAVTPGAAAGPLAPLSGKPGAVTTHAPYESGDCRVCHQGPGPGQPGPVSKASPELCLDCHEEFVGVLKRAHVHRPARRDCTGCHNPHNSTQPKLLLAESRALCLDCHGEIEALIDEAKVKHGAVATGSKCVSCHNPHGSAVERLLVARPFDLCVGCHDNERLADAGGRKLQNIKGWLAANPVWHDPVRAKDCSACHRPHGGEHFRLLKEAYPPEFYAPYDARRYALCFSCHNERAFSTAQTTTLTGFRDGAKNLHYVHLQQGQRGRTCRACHEVHASKQALHVREGVPYGSSGWVLKLNYGKTATGGSCEKTCHQKRSYSNRTAP